MDSESRNDLAVPQHWKITVGGTDPFRHGAWLELQEHVNPQTQEKYWTVAVSAVGAQSTLPVFLRLQGNIARSGEIWSGRLHLDDSAEWFLSFTRTQRPDNLRSHLYGILLGPLKPGLGQEQGTWGAEEENPA